MIDNTNAHVTGEYHFDLGGEIITLKRTLGALRTLNAQPGGLENRQMAQASTVITRLLNRDLDTCCAIIRAGMGIGPSAIKGLEQMVFEFGVDDIVQPLADFIFLLRTKAGTPLPRYDPQGNLIVDGEEGGAGKGDENPPGRGAASPPEPSPPKSSSKTSLASPAVD